MNYKANPMAVRKVTPDESTSQAAFIEAAKSMLTETGYQPDAADATLRSLPSPGTLTIYAVQTAAGTGYVGITTGKVNLRFVIPDDPSRRHFIAKSAIQQVQTLLDRDLFMVIEQDTPSHSAYLVDLLPDLGFDLEPRITMTAPLEVLARHTGSVLPTGFSEVGFVANRSADFLRLYREAGAAHQADWPADRRDRDWERFKAQLLEAQADDRALPTFTAVEREGQIVGACYGKRWDRELCIEELAVLPGFWRRGLGRFLTLRCMQKLKQHFGETDSYFFLGTNRTWLPAISLYRNLGFVIHRTQTYASWTPRRFAQSDTTAPIDRVTRDMEARDVRQ